MQSWLHDRGVLDPAITLEMSTSKSCSQTSVPGSAVAVGRLRETAKLRLTMKHGTMPGEGERHLELEMCGRTENSYRHWAGIPWRRKPVL